MITQITTWSARIGGKKPCGGPSAPPTGGVRSSDQIDLTGEGSRIMPVALGLLPSALISPICFCLTLAALERMIYE